MATDKRLIYRVILKVLSLLGLLILLFVFVNSLFTSPEKKEKNKQAKVALASLDLNGMQKGEVRKIRWEGKEVAVLMRAGNPVLHPTKYPTKLVPKTPNGSLNGGLRSLNKDYFVYFNHGNSGNCPLFYGADRFKDTCTSTQFDTSGREVGRGLQGYRLKIPPHYFKDKKLIIGEWLNE